MDVRSLLEKTLPGLGYELVDLELFNGNSLRVFIDKQPDGITIEDCVAVSNHLTRLLTVEEIDFSRLEISSPGLDRRLNGEPDFIRFNGQMAKIRTRLAIGQQKKFIGRLAGVNDGALSLEVDGQVMEIPLSNIDKARLEPEF